MTTLNPQLWNHLKPRFQNFRSHKWDVILAETQSYVVSCTQRIFVYG